MLNDTTAKLILFENRYPSGANSPTAHYEYECPCKKGKIIYEAVLGFDDRYAFFECEKCEKIYDFRYGCGHFWELERK
ncbi:MAG: hypothetical protein E7624_00955 [Ruminococcaceae bacterium]|nr:hypothetical protein [Oscillospiraceae bacterium]